MLKNRFQLGILTGLILFLSTGSAWSDIEDVKQGDTPTETRVEAGYRGVSAHGTPNRAREFDSLEASPTLDLSLRSSAGNNDFRVDVNYLNENDYFFEGDMNHKALMRVHLFNERFYHNLDHFPYDQTSEPEARPDGTFTASQVSGPPATSPQTFTRVDYTDRNPGAAYGLRLDLYEAAVRGKLPTYPAHLNLKYWRWEKSGRKQLRYVNEGCATSCHMNSQTRSIDRTTEEVSASIDAHLGWFDLVFEQVYRTFENHDDTPYDAFEYHYLRAPYNDPLTDTANYQHDEDPDAEFTESTLKANTTLGGGLVASASFSIGERNNESELYDVGPIKSDTDFKKLASDVTYIPSKYWTWNFRYRMLDMDNSNSDMLAGAGYQEWQSDGVLRTFEVRDNIDLVRDLYEGSVTFRPNFQYSIQGRYYREEIDRSNTDGPSQFDGHNAVIDPYWELPDKETIQKLRLTINSRHLEKNALKLKGWWEYQTSDDPAYNTSLEDSNTLFLSATYRPKVLWGGIASLRWQEASNEGYKHSQFDASDELVYYSQDRDQSSQNANLGLWYNPIEGVTLDLNFGYLRSRIVQDQIFGAEPPDYTIEDDDVEYRQSVHTLSTGVSWQALEALNCRLEGYHIRSSARYSPDFPTATDQYLFFSGPSGYLTSASSDDLRRINKVEIRQNGLKGRLNWQVDKHWNAALEATFDDYDDHGSDVFDGSVQTYMASISRSW